MECVVQVTRGSKLDPESESCSFCGNKATAIFCVTKSIKYDGVVLSGFPICKEHHDKLNALLSGEFDIDQIYLEQYRVKHDRKIYLRRWVLKFNNNFDKIIHHAKRKHPPLPIAKTIHKKSWQECLFLGCTNRYYGIKNKKYCDDPRCKEARKAACKAKGRKRLGDPDAKNLVISKTRFKDRLHNGQAIHIRCRARNSLKERCKNTFLITYDPKQKDYPMFCEEHRSAYRRLRYQERT